MLKKAVLRGLLGLPLGIAIGYVITIIISVVFAGGGYWSVHPVLMYQFGSEINAVIFQAFLCGVIGAVYAAASIIWELERWSIAKQTGIYFVVIAATMLPIVYFSHWMEHSVTGVLVYLLIFIAIFVIIWVTMWLIMWSAARRQVKQVNEKLREDGNDRLF
ncbi:MAG TPA: DUF3021 domain-containing protein [Coriobacteriia bacterium]|nr:DUF3021 domain-containing protein [Coriobacteriia bacterium]